MAKKTSAQTAMMLPKNDSWLDSANKVTKGLAAQRKAQAEQEWLTFQQAGFPPEAISAIISTDLSKPMEERLVIAEDNLLREANAAGDDRYPRVSTAYEFVVSHNRANSLAPSRKRTAEHTIKAASQLAQGAAGGAGLVTTGMIGSGTRAAIGNAVAKAGNKIAGTGANAAAPIAANVAPEAPIVADVVTKGGKEAGGWTLNKLIAAGAGGYAAMKLGSPVLDRGAEAIERKMAPDSKTAKERDAAQAQAIAEIQGRGEEKKLETARVKGEALDRTSKLEAERKATHDLMKTQLEIAKLRMGSSVEAQRGFNNAVGYMKPGDSLYTSLGIVSPSSGALIDAGRNMANQSNPVQGP